MSTHAPEVKAAPAQPPRVVEGPKPPTGTPARNLWIVAVIVALVVGAAGGYFLRWGTEPTKTVTRTVTETVTPPAYTTSDAVKAQVHFTGKLCGYTGPGELKSGTTVDFTYTAEDVSAQPSTLVVWRAEPGTTYEQLRKEFATFAANTPPPSVVYGSWHTSKPLGTANQTLTRTLNAKGIWGVSCHTSPESTNTPYLGALIRVLP